MFTESRSISTSQLYHAFAVMGLSLFVEVPGDITNSHAVDSDTVTPACMHMA